MRAPGDLAARARQAAARGDILVAAGGDGTVNAVANVAVEAHATMGVLPMGTLNHFAKDLGIPLDLEQAVAAISAGHGGRSRRRRREWASLRQQLECRPVSADGVGA